MSIDVYTELLKVIEQQQKTIERLVNENAELENYLNVMCKELG